MNLADAVEMVRERRQRGAHEEAARLLREYIIQQIHYANPHLAYTS